MLELESVQPPVMRCIILTDRAAVCEMCQGRCPTVSLVFICMIPSDRRRNAANL